MNKKLLALYGLKWNPFAPGVPVVGGGEKAHLFGGIKRRHGAFQRP